MNPLKRKISFMELENRPFLPQSVPANNDENKHKQDQKALDELFELTTKYRSGKSYLDLLKFVKSFRSYSPFNAMLIHVQQPGSRFVAPASRWKKEYGRAIKPTGRALVILQPMGPVMFVYDVADTDPIEGVEQKPVPDEVAEPFKIRSGKITDHLKRLIENAKRDGIRIAESNAGSQSAGWIQLAYYGSSNKLLFESGNDRKNKATKITEIPIKYDMGINCHHSKESQFATVVHELGHLYSGHLGTPNEKWWPNRQRLPRNTKEFEAESITHLVCTRLGLDNRSDEYLSGYLDSDGQVPAISLDLVMKNAWLIEKMAKSKMPLRKKT
jgi:hypothetical protein